MKNLIISLVMLTMVVTGQTESQVMGKDVASDAPEFFTKVLSEVGIPYSDFAYNALVEWAKCEVTAAKWNPLATTWNKKPIGKSWDFNP